MPDPTVTDSASSPEGASVAPGASAPPHRDTAALGDWFAEGLRASLFLRFRAPASDPKPLHLIVLIAVAIAIFLAAQRLAIPGEARFSAAGWLAHSWGVSLIILVVWSVFVHWRATDVHAPAVARWYALTTMGSILVTVVVSLYEAAWYRELLPEAWRESAFLAWAFALGIWGWMIAISVRVASLLGMLRKGCVLLGILLLLIYVANAMVFQQFKPWYQDSTENEEPLQRKPFTLSQEVIESQIAVRDQTFMELQPDRKAVRDVYAIVFAPYASEDVFKRESQLVTDVLRERFDAQGRVLQLLNHQDTARTLPWATTENLQRAIRAVAGKMDREHDVLVMYLTSHGARNFRLAAQHWPLEVSDLTPTELRQALDDAGVRNRVIMVSACYSGGWVEPLASDTTLVMTAADADHTSYGCGHRSPLTYFGRALWDEQLRQTHDFEAAFAKAVPVIRQREEEAKKADGFSNPQIRVGEAIRPVLQEIAQRLDGAGAR
ncbi:C13 family peptidase [Acidovorax sp. NCPPB 2350]|nr:C13 family peptidase [Acidovorax sp. NCPPB 2350]